MTTLVRLARIAILLVLLFTVLSSLIAIGDSATGPWEKVVLGAVVVGLFWVAARVTDLADRIQLALRARQIR